MDTGIHVLGSTGSDVCLCVCACVHICVPTHLATVLPGLPDVC